eukprot:30858-Pelagococcus_subviridis.AAC.10
MGTSVVPGERELHPGGLERPRGQQVVVHRRNEAVLPAFRADLPAVEPRQTGDVGGVNARATEEKLHRAPVLVGHRPRVHRGVGDLAAGRQPRARVRDGHAAAALGANPDARDVDAPSIDVQHRLRVSREPRAGNAHDVAAVFAASEVSQPARPQRVRLRLMQVPHHRPGHAVEHRQRRHHVRVQVVVAVVGDVGIGHDGPRLPLRARFRRDPTAVLQRLQNTLALHVLVARRRAGAPRRELGQLEKHRAGLAEVLVDPLEELRELRLTRRDDVAALLTVFLAAAVAVVAVGLHPARADSRARRATRQLRASVALVVDEVVAELQRAQAVDVQHRLDLRLGALRDDEHRVEVHEVLDAVQDHEDRGRDDRDPRERRLGVLLI